MLQEKSKCFRLLIAGEKLLVEIETPCALGSLAICVVDVMQWGFRRRSKVIFGIVSTRVARGIANIGT